jgi:hypothetical protein
MIYSVLDIIGYIVDKKDNKPNKEKVKDAVIIEEKKKNSK